MYQNMSVIKYQPRFYILTNSYSYAEQHKNQIYSSRQQYEELYGETNSSSQIQLYKRTLLVYFFQVDF